LCLVGGRCGTLGRLKNPSKFSAGIYWNYWKISKDPITPQLPIKIIEY
jgi:hypothetical protein